MADSFKPSDQQQRELLKRRMALREAEEAQRMMMSRFGSGDATFIEPVQLGDPGSDRTPEGRMVDEKIASAVGEIQIVAQAIIDPVGAGIDTDVNSGIDGVRELTAESVSQVVDAGDPAGAVAASHPPLDRAAGEPPQANDPLAGIQSSQPIATEMATSEIPVDMTEPIAAIPTEPLDNLSSVDTGESPVDVDLSIEPDLAPVTPMSDLLADVRDPVSLIPNSGRFDPDARERQEKFRETIGDLKQPVEFPVGERTPSPSQQRNEAFPTLDQQRTMLDQGDGGPGLDEGMPGETFGRQPNKADQVVLDTLETATESLDFYSEALIDLLRRIVGTLVRHTDQINELRDRLDAEDRLDGF